MDNAVVPWALAGVIGVLGTIAMGLFWRWLASSDKEADQRKATIDAAFAEHRQREEQARERDADLLAKYNDLKLELANKVSYNDLKELKDSMDKLSNTVIAALGHKGGRDE